MLNVLVDSGPLAALFNRRDHHHARALDFSAAAQSDFLDWLHQGHQRGLMHIAALAPDDLPGLARMMRKYADRPMDLADASLVWLANKNGITDIITIDRADFAVYRTARRKAFRNVFASS